MLLKLNRKQISIKIRFLKVYFSLRIELLTFWTLLTFTKVLIIPLPKQLTEKVKLLSQRHQSHCEPIYFLECNNVVDGGVATAQWIRIRLPFCRPGFESQVHHLYFFHL